jgi:hypothetical protein
VTTEELTVLMGFLSGGVLLGFIAAGLDQVAAYIRGRG